MSRRENQDLRERHSPWQIRFYLASIVILVAGLIGAAFIYATAPGDDMRTDLQLG